MKKTLYILFGLVILITLVIGIKFARKKDFNIENLVKNQNTKGGENKDVQRKISIIKVSTNILMSNNESFKTGNISVSELTNIIFNLDENPFWYNKKIVDIVGLTIFDNKKTVALTNFIEKLIEGKLKNDNKALAPFPDNLLSNRFYGDVLVAMRYHKLLPYMANKILEKSYETNNIKDIKARIQWLFYVPHPDTLRTILELDKIIPEDSYLRKDTRFGDLPFFYRKDCLDVYIEIIDQPEKYNHKNWYSAVEKTGWFTNDCAIRAYTRAYKVMKNFKKYWPELPDSISINRECMKTQMKTRQRIIDCKRPPRKRPKPLLDE